MVAASLPYLFRSDYGKCSELATGLMFDYFLLPIPDAESLPFYPLKLKLVMCVCVCVCVCVCRLPQSRGSLPFVINSLKQLLRPEGAYPSP